jgi:hypothetical protein
LILTVQVVGKMAAITLQRQRYVTLYPVAVSLNHNSLMSHFYGGHQRRHPGRIAGPFLTNGKKTACLITYWLFMVISIKN